MQTKIFQSFCCFLLAAFLWIGLSAPARADTEGTHPLVYTALGDSIASGYKLSQSSQGYVSLYSTYLSAQTTNLARAGLDSKGLLKLLTTDQNMMTHIQKSDIVTLSIGGNDLLPIFSKLAPTSPTGLLTAVQQINSKEMQQKFQNAVAQFGKNWDKIITQIHKLSPHAQIIATTLIDPYQGIVISIPPILRFDLGDYANRYIKQIDTVITGHAKSGKYAVANGYALFQQHKSEKLTNADLSKLDFDPHPNALGHRLLYQAYQSVPLTFTQNAIRLDGPTRIVIPADRVNHSAQFSAKPLFTCFTAKNINTQTIYSIEDAGTTGAVVDTVSGTLYVDKPGTVRLKATLSATNANWSAETTKTIRVTKALTPSAQKQLWIALICIGLAVLVALVLILLLLYRRKHAKHK